MTGPEHYREAEKLLERHAIAPEALVHATLALAAATAMAAHHDLPAWDSEAWHTVAATRLPHEWGGENR